MDLDDAAAAALYRLELEQDPAREHMGALFSQAGELGRTATVTSGQGAHVRGSLTKPTGSAWAALFHNHPPSSAGDTERAKFSDDDKAFARRLGVPSYISAGDRVRRFDPSTNKTSDVLAEFPMAEFREFLMRKLLDRAADDPRGLTR